MNAGSQVWIPDLQTKGTIQKDVSTRSYTVNTERGTGVRKNRRHLNHLPEETSRMKIQERQPEQAKSPSDAEKSGSATKTTRSGREVKTPNKYVEQC